LLINYGEGNLCHLRLDDTNPSTERELFVNEILRDMSWLGYDPGVITYTSDYFDKLFDFACVLIKTGYAYVDFSAPDVIKEADVAAMAPGAIVFALANPDPEIDPVIARKYAAVVATGRSDQPNQINNVLAFPGIFRGLLDGRITKITDAMLVAAADAISSCVTSDQLNANFIVPSVFDSQVVTKVAEAVKLVGRA
jgi:malic enzyme